MRHAGQVMKSMGAVRAGRPMGVAGMWLAMAMVLSGCGRNDEATGTVAAPAVSGAPAQDAAAAGEASSAPLTDVIERSPQAVIGISYPPGLERYPGLASALLAYSTAARAELQQALDGLGNDQPRMPYELSLAFEKLQETPNVVAVSAEGSRYTGGAHGEPLVARFVWLPKREKMLAASELITDPKGWQAISSYVADQLRERVATRLSGEELQPGELQESLRSATRMIAEGTGADAANFSQFEPIVDGEGRITALRFVFPPYQVAPYADGTQTADVPASVLEPHLSAEYTTLFAGS